MKKWRMLALLYLALSLCIVGCKNAILTNDVSDEETVASQIEILWDESSGVDVKLVSNLLESKYPKATFNVTPFRHPIYESERNITKLFENNELSADLVFFESTIAPFFVNIDYLEPLEGFMVAENIQESTFETQALNVIREHTADDHIPALPLGKNVYALYYNKDAMTKYGVDMPVDGMLWSEVIELGQKVGSQSAFNQQFVLSLIDSNLITNQLGLTYENDGAESFQSNEWLRAYDFFSSVAEIENNNLYAYTNQNQFGPDFNSFANGQSVMAASGFLGNRGELPPPYYGFRKEPEVEWDIVSYPTFDQSTAPTPTYYYLGIPKVSTKKEEALKVMSYLLSKEAQIELSKNGLASAYFDQTINQEFGQNISYLKGKNINAFFQSTNYSSYDKTFDFRIRYQFSSLLDHLYIAKGNPNFESTRGLYTNELANRWKEAEAQSKQDIQTIKEKLASN